MNVSTATWKGAIDHAERRVILAERKMSRLRNDQALRVARLKVILTATQTLSLSVQFLPPFFLILSFHLIFLSSNSHPYPHRLLVAKTTTFVAT